MKKTKRIISAALAVLMLSMSALLCGCDLFKQGLESGFDIKGHIDPLMCAYRSDKTEFDINDVTLLFYYGYYYEEYNENENFISYDICFFDENENKHLIKSVEENIMSEKYRINKNRNKFLFFDHSKFDFSYSEALTIPKEVFIKDNGVLEFSVIIHTDLPEDEEIVSGILIYYKVDENKVTLSAK